MATSFALLTAATANGAGPTVYAERFAQDRKNPATLHLYGVFGGASVTINASPDHGTTWIAVASAYTSAGVVNLDFTTTAVQAVVASASGTTNLNAVIW